MCYQAALRTVDTFPPGTVRSLPCLKGHGHPLPARHECANWRDRQSGVARVLCHSELSKANPGSSCRSREQRALEESSGTLRLMSQTGGACSTA